MELVTVHKATEMETSYKKMFDKLSAQYDALSSRLQTLEVPKQANSSNQEGKKRNRGPPKFHAQSTPAAFGTPAGSWQPPQFPQNAAAPRFSTSVPDFQGNERQWATSQSVPQWGQSYNHQRHDPAQNQRRPFKGTCFYCNQEGHRQADCPLKG